MPESGHFLGNQLVLLGWHHIGKEYSEEYSYDLRKIGGETLATVKAQDYVGTVEGGKRLVFVRPEIRSLVTHEIISLHPGVLFFDSEKRTSDLFAIAGLKSVQRFPNGTAALLCLKDGSIWLSDLKDLSVRREVVAAGTQQKFVGVYQTIEGKVLLTRDYDPDALVVRYLDR